ncbi:hypothetical protein KXD40_001896 [Peronospora effusa]|nr:hypothetical protein KXD40_001896 [Peronospora effusa]CAI5704614.1 unnamed protein product [Peronospora effusa]
MLYTAQSLIKEEVVKAATASSVTDIEHAWVSIPVKSSSEIGEWTPTNKTRRSPNQGLDDNRWGNVKTWTFVQFLASSFVKVLLENAMGNGGDLPGEKKLAIKD